MTLADGPGRGLWAGEDRLFAAAGTHIYEIKPDGTALDIPGTIRDDDFHSPVQFFAPTVSKELFIVASGLAYICTGLNILPVYVGDELLEALTGAYLDNYYIVQKPQSKQFNFFGPIGAVGYEDSTKWNALDFDIKAGAADNLSAIQGDHGELWLLGKKSVEVWANVGDLIKPFQRIQGAFTEQGCIATWSVARVDNTLMCLGGDDRGGGMVWQWRGFIPTRVSNHAIEQALQKYSRLDDAIAYSYQDQGHSFYVLSFPDAKATWVYDATALQWHERGYWNLATGQYEDVLGRYHAYVWGKHFVQDRRNGKIYEQSVHYYDDAGNPIRRLRSAPYIADELKWMKFPFMKLDMMTGKGPSMGQGSDPVVMMQFSDDGGYTWSNESWSPAGPIGKYLYRVVWRRLGRSRKRVYRVIITDPIPICLIEAYTEAVVGK